MSETSRDDQEMPLVAHLTELRNRILRIAPLFLGDGRIVCGYDRDGSASLARELVASGVLPAGVPVHAVDANASWARPGTRLVDGVEELAEVLHPTSARARTSPTTPTTTHTMFSAAEGHAP